MRLSIYCDGNLVATRPQGLSENSVERFIIQKANWILSKLEHFKKFKGNFFFRNNKAEYLKHKEEARKFIGNRIEHFNNFYNFQFNRINIRNQKTRWGSCSKKGNLNFNYKVALLPARIADYIIVHELCHLKEFNHSKEFWDLVSRTAPDHRDIRKELRNSRLNLH
ncbi:MAG TPA: M48 family peptidase [Candidatus Moranbacteria bacterium]|nr:M48 family peptidase [Candidatus Moranbacteria bacterium]HDZ85132.1 M48 family peptidase [Candidatus Moranbacteria bacterium]